MDKIRMNGLKDCTGAVLSPDMAFAMLENTETLALRYNKMSENAVKLAQYLEKHPKVEKVVCTGLDSHPQHDLCKKYLNCPNTLFSCYLKGGLDECVKMMNKF